MIRPPPSSTLFPYTTLFRSERFKFRPFGLAGGGAAKPGTLTLIRDGARNALPSKVNNLRLRRGDIIRLETSGGGGFGDPAERSEEHTSELQSQSNLVCRLLL